MYEIRLPLHMNDYFSKKVKKEKKPIETLNINCPSCNEENIVKLSSEIKCKHCEEPLTKTKYGKLKTPFIGTITAVIIGSAKGVMDVSAFNSKLIFELVNQEFLRQKKERVSQNVNIGFNTKIKSALTYVAPLKKK